MKNIKLVPKRFPKSIDFSKEEIEGFHVFADMLKQIHTRLTVVDGFTYKDGKLYTKDGILVSEDNDNKPSRSL